MRILHIVGSGGFGGIERLVLDLARVQKRTDGCDIDVLFSDIEERSVVEFSAAGLQCHSANLRSGYDVSPAKYSFVRSLCLRSDIIHFHSYSPLFVAASIRSRRPIVFTMHGNYFGLGRKPAMAERVKSALLKRFLNRHVDFVAFNSNFVRGLSENRYDLRNVARTTVYNGVDLTSIQGARKPLEPGLADRLRGRFVVGTSSRFAVFKRIDRLIDGFAEFQRNKPDALLLLVGDGVLRHDFEQKARVLGISDKTVFTGYRQNVHDFQDAMDICVFPSESEPFGLAAVETLSLGKPTIIFSDGGGLVEIVAGCVRDDVVTDVANLSARLERYYRDRETISRDSARRRDCAARYDIRKTASEYSRIYRNLVSNAA